jgi:hypothetical protein
MSTCAVVTRVQRIEAPYLNEFIYWYQSWGFDRIYFVNTEGDQTERIRSSIAPEYLRGITFLQIDKEIQNEPGRYLVDRVKAAVKEEYVLNVDCDEFLYLDTGRFPRIQDFVSQHGGARFFSFQWVNVPCFDVCCNSMVGFLLSEKSKFHHNTTLKSLGAVDGITSMDWHVMNGGHRSRRMDPIRDRCFVLHFIVRSLSHQILKQFHQRMNNFKDRKEDRLGECLTRVDVGRMSPHEYPFRMLATMILQSIGERHDIKDCVRPLLRGVPVTPDRYRAASRSVLMDIGELLERWFPERRFQSIEAVEAFLRSELALERKLDIRLLPEDALVSSPEERLRTTVERVYTLARKRSGALSAES